jgi:hypothetical protein
MDRLRRNIGQFEFTEWTPDHHLRHARFVGLRTDKNARDTARHKPIVANKLRSAEDIVNLLCKHIAGSTFTLKRSQEVNNVLLLLST